MIKKVRIVISVSGTIEDIATRLILIAKNIQSGHYTSDLYQDGICTVETEDLLFKIKDISK
jgi:hypothetical protein